MRELLYHRIDENRELVKLTSDPVLFLIDIYDNHMLVEHISRLIISEYKQKI